LAKRAKLDSRYFARFCARFAPPASGETTTSSLASDIVAMTLRLTYAARIGRPAKFSNGTVANPWICGAWSVTVTIRSHPAVCSMSVTKRDATEQRTWFIWSCRA
jgi:hypothetical protein